MVNFLEAARSVHRVFVLGNDEQKRQVVQLVASNGVLADRKVRLSLKRAPAILAERPKLASGARSRTMFELFSQLRDAFREGYYHTSAA